MSRYSPLLALSILLLGCDGGAGNGATNQSGAPPPAPIDDGSSTPSAQQPFVTSEIARFDEPWAMTFVGDGPYALVTEKKGKLYVLNTNDASKMEVNGVPQIDYGGQGGFGDVVSIKGDNPLSSEIYLSWVEAGPNDTRGAVVAQGTITIDEVGDGEAILSNLRIIWRQVPKVTGRGHFSHRIAVAPDGQHIFISSGDRQKMEPAQDMSVNLGKIIRLRPDGSVPADNPFADQGGVTAQIWSFGHRNGLGLAFDAEGRLWESEMGPQGGDEVNLIQRGENYGWPRASNGSHYGGEPIPDHHPNDRFRAPKAWWTPSVSPAGMTHYDGALFPQWRNSLFVGALSGQALIRLQIQGETLIKADHWPMERIREVEAGPDGAIWLLEDGPDARLLRLTPAG